MNIYDRKAAAFKVMTRDSEAVGKERYDEKQTRRSIVRTREDTVALVSHLSFVNRQLRWIRILLILILLVLIVIAIP